MPFTLSHTIVAVPIAKVLRLPIAGVVIGSMSPDLIRFFTDNTQLAFLAHRWQGLIYPDLVLSLLFLLLWYSIYRPVIFHFLKIQAPFTFNGFLSYGKFLLLLILGILIGTASHIIWDGLTHLDFRTFAFKQELAQTYRLFGHRYPLHRILQIGCSALALPVVLWLIYRYIQNHKIAYQYTAFDFIAGCSTLVLTLASSCYALYHYFQSHQYLIKQDFYFFIGKAINVSVFMGLVCFSLCCLVILILQKLKN